MNICLCGAVIFGIFLGTESLFHICSDTLTLPAILYCTFSLGGTIYSPFSIYLESIPVYTFLNNRSCPDHFTVTGRKNLASIKPAAEG